jgi:hypothetical protein
MKNRLPIQLGFRMSRLNSLVSQDEILKMFKEEKPDTIIWGHDISVPDDYLYIPGELVYSVPKKSKSHA